MLRFDLISERAVKARLSMSHYARSLKCDS